MFGLDTYRLTVSRVAVAVAVVALVVSVLWPSKLVIVVAAATAETAETATATATVKGSIIEDPLDYVNPYIGTGGLAYGVGSIPGGVQIPFAKVRLSPDTCFVDDIWVPWQHFGGYHYTDTHIRMLSHTHLFGAGVVDYGNVGVFPTTFVPDFIGNKYIYDRFPWLQPFSHEREIIKPGYYSVQLLNNNIEVELTSTMNTGIHRYTFNNTGNDQTGSYVVIDPSYSLNWEAVVNMSLQVDYSTQTITGFTHAMGALSGRFGGVIVYFAIRFNKTFSTKIHGWNEQQNVKSFVTPIQIIDLSNNNGIWSVNSTSTCGVFVQFENTNSVEMYVGISFISVQQALLNLETEMTSFETAQNDAIKMWQQQLSVISIQDDSLSYLTKDNLTVFYTALYHTLCVPTTFSEVGGVYLGFDNQVHTVNTGNTAYYTDMSLWDVHRTQYPLLALLAPDIMGDIVQSLVEMYKQGGDLPRWPLANGYTNCMIGQHADIVISDAIAHGLADKFEVSVAYSGMYQGATQPQANAGRSSVQAYIELGYVPYEQDNVACCDTLEYAYDDWACAQVAMFLNKTSDYEMFMNRSLNYRNVFDPTTQFMCPRYSDGTFDCPYSFVNLVDKRYVEGDAWHWRWFAPQDTPGLISLFESTEYFVEQLNHFINASFKDPVDIMPNPFYWQGNEEDLFAPYQFPFIGNGSYQYLTSFYVRQLLATKFLNKPHGLPGNDDYGTMSGWIVFSYLGFYPRAGDGLYILGSPMFTNVTIHRDNGDITLVAYNNSKSNLYIKEFKINGVVQKLPFFNIKDVMNGGLLEVWMTDVWE